MAGAAKANLATSGRAAQKILSIVREYRAQVGSANSRVSESEKY